MIGFERRDQEAPAECTSLLQPWGMDFIGSMTVRKSKSETCSQGNHQLLHLDEDGLSRVADGGQLWTAVGLETSFMG